MRQETLSAYEGEGDREVDDTTCRTCGREFKSKHGVSAHAWQIHDERPFQVDLECDHCGSDIQCHEDEVYDTNFCDDECQYAYQTGENHPNSNQETRSCDNCGGPVTRCVAHFKDNTFCNRGCYAQWLSDTRVGVDHPLWTRERVECNECGGGIWRAAHTVDGRDHYCNRSCMGKSFSESAPPSLVSAVRSALSDRAWWEVSRDWKDSWGDGCELCGDDGSGTGRANVTHHIVPVIAGGTNADELLMEVCMSCHNKVEAYTKAIPEVHPVIVE